MLILSILFPVLLGLIILLKREFKNRKVLLTLTGAGLAITKGSRITRPVIILVLALLFLKILGII